MTDMDIVWRLARFAAYLLVAGYGLMAGAYLWIFSPADPAAALNAIFDIGIAGAADYVRVNYLRASSSLPSRRRNPFSKRAAAVSRQLAVDKGKIARE